MRKKYSQAVSLFCTFRICTCKSCTLNVVDINPSRAPTAWKSFKKLLSLIFQIAIRPDNLNTDHHLRTPGSHETCVWNNNMFFHSRKISTGQPHFLISLCAKNHDSEMWLKFLFSLLLQWVVELNGLKCHKTCYF